MKEGSASVRVRRRPWREEAGDTLDTATVSDVRHNLRAALRSKYKLDESITIKHFGYIDQPQPQPDQECGPISLPALSSLHSHNQSRSPSTMMRGVMWIHRDRYFSRWKERFVVVTRDYLQCYKRVVTEASQMGPFLNQVRLCDVRGVSLVDRKGYLTLLLELAGEDSLVLRRAENIREWYTVILHLATEARAKSVHTVHSPDTFWRGAARLQEAEEEEQGAWLVSRRAPGPRPRPRLQEARPPSVASVDRRHRTRHRRRAKSHTPGEAACPAPHVATCQSGAGLRSVSVDRDSGHYSLHTVATVTSAKQQEF